MGDPLTHDPGTVGVRFVDAAGREHLVHAYSEEQYGLEDIHTLFGLGDLASEDEPVELVLSGSEVRAVKALADAQSFDHPQDFIAMCLDIHEFTAGRGDGPFRFRARD